MTLHCTRSCRHYKIVPEGRIPDPPVDPPPVKLDSKCNMAGMATGAVHGEVVDTKPLPTGWQRVERVSSTGKRYFRFEGPGGQKAQSRPEAWRLSNGSAVLPDAARPSAPVAAGSSQLASAPRSEQSGALPAGWQRVERVSSTGKRYFRFEGPGGQKAQSRLEAWRLSSGSATSPAAAEPRHPVDSGSTEQPDVVDCTTDSGNDADNDGEAEEVGDGWLTVGHKYLGQRVLRAFGKRLVLGCISRWVPAHEKDSALFHVVHDDGDEEDLEESEAAEAVERYSTHPEAKKLAAVAEKRAARGAAKLTKQNAKRDRDELRHAGKAAKQQAREAKECAKAAKELLPRRARSALSIFSRDARATLAEEMPELNGADLGKLLSKRFRELDGEVRATYERAASADRERYRRECETAGIDPNEQNRPLQRGGATEKLSQRDRDTHAEAQASSEWSRPLGPLERHQEKQPKRSKLSAPVGEKQIAASRLQAAMHRSSQAKLDAQRLEAEGGGIAAATRPEPEGWLPLTEPAVAAELMTVWAFSSSFGDVLGLSRFTAAELCLSLQRAGEPALLIEFCSALLRTLLRAAHDLRETQLPPPFEAALLLQQLPIAELVTPTTWAEILRTVGWLLPDFAPSEMRDEVSPPRSACSLCSP